MRGPVLYANADESTVAVRLTVNGDQVDLDVDPRVTVLDALRGLGLTGTKKGCDHGQCGACTIHVAERSVLSCLALVVAHDGAEITTIEGLSADGAPLHPVQAAFLDCDGLQCGFCTPGQIMSAVALLTEAASRATGRATPSKETSPAAAGLTDEEIRERMSGNLCRCGAYPGILAAVRSQCGVDAR